MASCPHALTCASSRLERVDVLDVDDDGTTRVLHAPFLGERDSIVEGRARFVDLRRTDEAITVQRLAIDHRDGNLRSRMNIGQRLPAGVFVEYQRPIIADTQGTLRTDIGSRTIGHRRKDRQLCAEHPLHLVGEGGHRVQDLLKWLYWNEIRNWRRRGADPDRVEQAIRIAGRGPTHQQREQM